MPTPVGYVGLAVRPWRVDDIATVTELENRSFASPWSEEMLRRELDNEQSRGLIVVSEQDPAGLAFALYWIVVDEAHLLIIAVDPHHRRRGVGRWLVAELAERAVEEGATLIDLEVRPTNTAAREMYRSMGFQEVGIRPRYYPDREDAILLQQHIGPE